MPSSLASRILALILAIAQAGILCPVPALGDDSAPVYGLFTQAPSASEMIRAGEGGTVRLGSAEIEIPPGALARDTEIRITRLWVTEDTGDGIKNVTSGGGGYRFEPAGTKFAVPATIRMGYDPDLSESAKETLYTYYFDTKAKRWEQLDRAGLETDRIISLTTHFTDMINGTLSLPEGPAPLRFNINSIKGLEAANPSSGVPGIEGLEANNNGSAGFRIPIETPPGRAGMAPQVAVIYSSDAGNGIMGRGFDLQAGGRIMTDTRWGVPRFNGRNADTGGLDRDEYLLDGVRLRETGRTNEAVSYRPLRETKYEKIERVIWENNARADYWTVTDKGGTRRTYGMTAGCWSGRNADRKYIWELEEERDVFGNTVQYKYTGGSGQLFLDEIVYTGSARQANLAVYSVKFEYETGRQDVRVDGRGGYDGRIDRLLKRITVNYRGAPVRRYQMEYNLNMYGASHMSRFGQMRDGASSQYLWSYGFEYEEMDNKDRLFAGPVRWKGMENGIQVQAGVSGGTQGSVSGGVGLGGDVFDLRVNGGVSLSHSDSSTETKHTFIDLNGDGRPDSVRVASGNIEVFENTGNGFRRVSVKGDMPDSIGEDHYTNTSQGWNTGANAASKYVGAGYTFAKTTQRGWGGSEAGFADIDGDGLVDIIISDDYRYYRNTSKDGNVEFVRTVLPVASWITLPADYVEELKEENKETFDDAYYQEAPLREWRAPYKGKIRVTQDVKAVSSLSGDGITARAYYHGNTIPFQEIPLGKNRLESGSISKTASIEAEHSMYFLSDAGEDTRGDDIVWGITITYEEMQYFADMDKKLRYVPPAGFRMEIAERNGNMLAELYDEVKENIIENDRIIGSRLDYYKLSDRDWETVFTDADKNRKSRAWEEIVRLGWFVPGYVEAEHFSALWEKANSLARQAEGPDYRQALIAYYQYHAGADAYLRNTEAEMKYTLNGTAWHWKIIERNIRELIQTVQRSDSGYYNKLAGYWWGAEDSQKLAYPVPSKNGLDSVFITAAAVSERIYNRERGKPGHISTNGGSRRLIIDVIEGQEWSIGINAGITLDIEEKTKINNTVVPPVIEDISTIDVTVTEPFSEYNENMKHSVPYYIGGIHSGTASLEKRNGRISLTVPVTYNNTLRHEQKYEFNGFHWISQVLTLEDIELIRIRQQGSEYTASHRQWQGELAYGKIRPVLEFCVAEDQELFFNAFTRIPPPLLEPEDPENPRPPPADRECTYVLRLDEMDEEEIAGVNRILAAYGRSLFLPEYFPFYNDNGRGEFTLKEEYSERAINKEYLERMFIENRPLLFLYQKLIEYSLAFNFMHYAGDYNRELLYYAGGIYQIENGGILLRALEADGNGYADVPIQQKRVDWNSGDDYTNEKRKPYSYTKTVNAREAANNEAVKDFLGGRQINDESSYDVEICPETVELLPGGVNRWYYGVWLGNQGKEKFSFSREKLYKNRNRTVSEEEINNRKNNMSSAPRDESTVYYIPVKTVEDEFKDLPGGQTVLKENNVEVENDALIGSVTRIIDNAIKGDSVVSSVQTYFPYIHRNRIHTNRAGGLSYYAIPGILPKNTGNSRGNLMPTVRYSGSSGDDTAHNASLDPKIPFGDAYGVLDAVKETVELVRDAANINTGYNHSSNKSESWVEQSVQDIDGNGIADIVQVYFDGQSEHLKVTSAGRNGFDYAYDITGITDISRSKTDVTTHGGTIGAGGSTRVDYNGSGKFKGVIINGGNTGSKDNISVGAGGSYADGSNTQTAGFIDMNGDGLPDYVINGSIKMNLGREAFEEGLLPNLHGSSLNAGSSITVASSMNIGTGFGNDQKSDIETSSSKSSLGISGGLNYSVSMNETESMLIDMNGDGLPDMVSADNGVFTVRYNLGDRFDNAQRFNAPGWSINFDDELKFGAFSDVSLLVGVFENLPLIGKIDWITDVFNNKGLALNPFGSSIKKYLDKLETNQNISIGISVSANTGATASFYFPPSPFAICFTIGNGAGFNAGANISGISMRMMDMDGDGLPDRVLRIPGTDYLEVQRNLGGRVGLLRKITIPQGGEYSLDYDWEPGTVKMPHSRYVLCEVIRRGNSGNGVMKNPGYASEDEYITRYFYSDGYYDRNEKESYGFRLVTAASADRHGNAMGKTVTEYYVGQYHLRGAPHIVSAWDERGNSLLRRFVFDADTAPFARNVRELREAFEKESDGSAVSSETRYSYDDYGNVLRLEERANSGETITADIRYWNSNNPYFHAHPVEITVRGSESGLLRKRTGSYYNDTGMMKTLTQMRGENGSSGDSTSSIEWDVYGNLLRITDPGGAYAEYRYDVLQQYAEEITAGGPGIAVPYKSYIEWDPALGRKIKETDENRQSIDYVYDAYGRLIEVWSPYDRYKEGGTVPAVRYRYETPEKGNWYAVTENKIQFDSGNADTLTTVAVIDGFGRALYTAKQGEVRDGNSKKEGWNVSGFTAYDGKGRGIKIGQPLFVGIKDADALAAGWNMKDRQVMLNPTEQEYDSLDRAVRTILPVAPGTERPSQTSRYAVRGGLAWVITTDPLGNISEQESDGRGNITKVRRLDKNGSELTKASYRYNGLGEMLAAIDADGSPLTVEYDRLGRRVKMASADIGVKEWQYDASGRVEAEWGTASLSRRASGYSTVTTG